jgi:hypothetical protein
MGRRAVILGQNFPQDQPKNVLAQANWPGFPALIGGKS